MSRILVADHGVSAVRVFRACAEEGVRSIAIYEDHELASPHSRLADEAYALHGVDASQITIDSVIALARAAGADAVHPGQGPLAADTAAARATVDAGLVWLGSSLERQSLPESASSGTAVRRIDVLVVADGSRPAVVVGAADCTVGRRGRALVSEAPAPVGQHLSAELHEAAREGAERMGLRGVGTAMFEIDRDDHARMLRFHVGITDGAAAIEAVTGVDVVREQLRIALGRPGTVGLAPAQHGHAMSFAVFAEDPGRGFLPSGGTVVELREPGGPGIRWEASSEVGCAVPARFDELLACLTVTGQTRAAALARSRRAIEETMVRGVVTGLPLLRSIVDSDRFRSRSSQVSLRWVEESLMPSCRPEPRAVAAPTQSLERVEGRLDGRDVRLRVPPGTITGSRVSAES